jgi:hypothetical protein
MSTTSSKKMEKLVLHANLILPFSTALLTSCVALYALVKQHHALKS